MEVEILEHNEVDLIKCPYCGKDQPDSLELFDMEEYMVSDEEEILFTCEFCNKNFKIITHVSFTVEKMESDPLKN